MEALSEQRLINRLLSGGTLSSIAQEQTLSPDELLIALGEAGLVGDGPSRPALARERPLHPALQDALSEQAIASILPDVPRTGVLALSAGLLLIHDFWEASHEAAQLADDLGEKFVSAYWHGIAHRREPDPGNASYWFRRVGKHAIFPKLASYTKNWLAEHPGAEKGGRLLEGGAWNPYAMIELCGEAKSGSPAESLALDLQREEMRLLLRATVDRVVVGSG